MAGIIILEVRIGGLRDKWGQCQSSALITLVIQNGQEPFVIDRTDYRKSPRQSSYLRILWQVYLFFLRNSPVQGVGKATVNVDVVTFAYRTDSRFDDMLTDLYSRRNTGTQRFAWHPASQGV